MNSTHHDAAHVRAFDPSALVRLRTRRRLAHEDVAAALAARGQRVRASDVFAWEDGRSTSSIDALLALAHVLAAGDVERLVRRVAAPVAAARAPRGPRTTREAPNRVSFLRFLDVLRAAGGWMTLRQLAAAAGVSRSATRTFVRDAHVPPLDERFAEFADVAELPEHERPAGAVRGQAVRLRGASSGRARSAALACAA